MAGSDNLIGHGFDERTADEQRKIARQGGIASGESRRRAASMREAAKILLQTVIQAEDLDGVVRDMTAAEAIMLRQLQKAAHGDRKSAEFVRDTGGERPAVAVEVSGADKNAAAAVEALIMGGDPAENDGSGGE